MLVIFGDIFSRLRQEHLDVMVGYSDRLNAKFIIIIQIHSTIVEGENKEEEDIWQ